MQHRMIAVGFAFGLAALAGAGCGSSPEAERAKYHAELARYTPEILAAELSSRLGSLRGASATAAEKAGADKGGESGKKTEASGKANPFSPDAVIEDVAKKAKKIEGKPPSEVCAEIISLVDKSSLDDSTKSDVRSKLKSAMGL